MDGAAAVERVVAGEAQTIDLLLAIQIPFKTALRQVNRERQIRVAVAVADLLVMPVEPMEQVALTAIPNEQQAEQADQVSY